MLRRMTIAKKFVDSDNICFLSFTKAGAKEALKRLELPRSDKICTIHSLMYRLNGIPSQSVIDNRKLQAFGMKMGIEFTGRAVDTFETMALGDQFMSILDKSRAKMSAPETEYFESARPGELSHFVAFVEGYKRFKQANGYIDFTDMLQMYIDNPVPHGGVAIYIDEAQDLSNLQWQVIRTMVRQPGVRQVTIAGDDDQAVFEWSGANPHGMIEFEQEYKATRAVLGQSWRVPTRVHKLAMDIIGRVSNRVDKEYKPQDKPGAIDTHPWFSTDLIEPGVDTLILCRNFVSRQHIENELMRAAIPYVSDGGRVSLFDNKIANGIRAFKRLSKKESPMQHDINDITAVADARTREDIRNNDWHKLIDRGWFRSLVVPTHLIEYYRSVDLNAKATVRMSTIHSAKGREADHVILDTSLTDKTSMDMLVNPDAEHRVWYVAVTRAKKRLDMITSDNCYSMPSIAP